jgi:hypothetical protein
MGRVPFVPDPAPHGLGLDKVQLISLTEFPAMDEAGLVER